MRRRFDSIECLIRTHIDNTMFEQAAERISSINRHSTRPETRRQKGLVSAQCEFVYELSCNHRDMNLPIDCPGQ